MNHFEMTTPAVPYAYESFVQALRGAPKAPRGGGTDVRGGWDPY